MATLVVLGACVGDEPAPGGAPGAGVDAGGSSSGSSSGASGGSSSGNGPLDSATSCPSELADCNGDGVCETAPASDPEHCGACGHACQGGLCAEGRCLPQTIASSVVAPLDLAVNSTGVFWIDAAQALKCSKTGCLGAPTVLASNSKQVEQQGRRQLFVNEETLAWLGGSDGSNDVFVYSCAVGGCSLQPSPRGAAQRRGLLVGNADSLFAYDGTGSLRKIPLAGGAATYMTKTYKESSFTFAALGDVLAFSNTDDSTNGGKGVWLGTAQDTPPVRVMDEGLHLALNGSTVVASVSVSPTQNTIVSCATTGCGGTGTPLFASFEGVIEDLVADDAAVYWAVRSSPNASDGTIRSCSLPDCVGGPRTVASNQSAPFALALDSDFVYWANRGGPSPASGSIQRVRR